MTICRILKHDCQENYGESSEGGGGHSAKLCEKFCSRNFSAPVAGKSQSSAFYRRTLPEVKVSHRLRRRCRHGCNACCNQTHDVACRQAGELFLPTIKCLFLAWRWQRLRARCTQLSIFPASVLCSLCRMKLFHACCVHQVCLRV